MSAKVEFEVRVFQDVPDDAPDDVDPPELTVSSVDFENGTVWVYLAVPDPTKESKP